jgi:2-C-methyl-D-erythritol 2,4-cyclodiphosphate synthase
MKHGFRIGTGFDAHRLAIGRPLILGGVEVASDKGAEGHSDADAACHALIDAIFGAMADGDIGSHFPDTDPAYKNISSLKLLKQTGERMRAGGYELANADLTVMLEKPKIAAYKESMRAAVAEALGAEVARISVKATTTEGLGFIGRGEGVAAQAAVLLVPRAGQSVGGAE